MNFHLLPIILPSNLSKYLLFAPQNSKINMLSIENINFTSALEPTSGKFSSPRKYIR